MENNGEKAPSVEQKQVTKEGQFIDFAERVEMWREHLNPGFADALKALVGEIPLSEQGHYLFGEEKNGEKGIAFLDELRSLDSFKHLVIKDLPDWAAKPITEESMDVKQIKNNKIAEINEKLNLLLQVYPKSSFLNNLVNTVGIYADRQDLETLRVYHHVLRKWFVVSQQIICHRWRQFYNLRNTVNDKSDEQEKWKIKAWEKFNNPYVLEQISAFLNNKIAGIGACRREANPDNLKTIANAHAFYFKGYDTDTIKRYWNEDMTNGQSGKMMTLNPYTNRAEGEYFVSLIDYTKAKAASKHVYTLEQAELLNYIADLIADYPIDTWPVLELPLKKFMQEYQFTKVFPDYKPYHLLSI